MAVLEGTPELTMEDVNALIDQIVDFCEALSDDDLFPYQREFGRRIVDSVVTGDGEELTCLQSRQSGKSQTVAVTFAGMAVILPVLATWDQYKALLHKFRRGVLIGVFAPVEEQAKTLHGRIKGFLDNAHAKEIMSELGVRLIGKGIELQLNNGSVIRRQTANQQASIESKTYHVVVIDECQDASDFVITKSISPMLAFHLGTIVKTGTPNRRKGHFYEAIKRNERRQISPGFRKKNHFQYDWTHCAKYNPNYKIFVEMEMERIGEDSDEFQLSYCCRWLLGRGMLIVDERYEELMDSSMGLVQSWTRTPVLVGVDPARTNDSTVVTVLYVDWDQPDEFGYHYHRVLNWLELLGDDYESQYYQIVDFLKPYDVWAMAVDANGMGGPFGERMALLLPRVEVHALQSDNSTQSKRWKHLVQLLDRGMVGWPGHRDAKRTKKWQRFRQQMTDVEKEYKGPNLLVAAPSDQSNVHDDYPDSLALACALTKDLVMPEGSMDDNPMT